jgi:hypothetical protein
LDFLFAEEEIQCAGNSLGTLTKLLCQIGHADDHIPAGVALMDIAPVGRNLVSESAQFLLPVMLRTVGSGFVGFEKPSAGSCNSDKTSDQQDPPVQGLAISGGNPQTQNS